MKITHALGLTAYLVGNTSSFVFFPSVCFWGGVHFFKLLASAEMTVYTQLVQRGLRPHRPELSSEILKRVEESTATALKWHPRLKKIVLVTGVIMVISLLVLSALEFFEPYDDFHRNNR